MFKNTYKKTYKIYIDSKMKTRKLNKLRISSNSNAYSPVKLLPGLGMHTSISPSLLEGLEYAQALGATAVQFFTGSNTTASLKVKHQLTPEETTKIRQYLLTTKIQIVIHAVYVLNFCAHPATSGRIQYAHQNLHWDLNQAQQLGGGVVVLHIGNQMSLSREEAIQNMVSNTAAILKWMTENTPDVVLALETPAGQGTQICATLDELSDLWRRIMQISGTKEKRHLGICIDTAHIFTSGIDIRTPALLNDYLSEFDKKIGIDQVRVFHLNDSKRELAGHRDLHEGLGDGFIFKEDKCKSVIRELVKFAKKWKIPIILETHRSGSMANPDGELYGQELALLRRFREGNAKAGCDWELKHRGSYRNITSKKSTPAKKYSSKQNQTVLGLANPANLGLMNKLADLKEYYTLVEADKIRALAYGKAWLTIKNYPEEIMNGQQIAHLEGIGAKMVKKIDEYLTRGEMEIFKELQVAQKLTEAKKAAQQEVGAVLGIGPARALALGRQGIHTVPELRQAVSEGKIKLNSAEAIGLQYHDDLIKKIPRAETDRMLAKIAAATTKTHPDFNNKWQAKFELAGSYPSGKLESKDIDLLVFSPKIQTLAELKKHGAVLMRELESVLQSAGILVAMYSRGESKLLLLAKLDGKHPVRHIDIRLIPEQSAIFGRLYFTSGRDFNQILRLAAKKVGLKLNEFGLYHGNELVPNLETEEDVMTAIGVPFVPMAKRR